MKYSCPYCSEPVQRSHDVVCGGTVFCKMCEAYDEPKQLLLDPTVRRKRNAILWAAKAIAANWAKRGPTTYVFNYSGSIAQPALSIDGMREAMRSLERAPARPNIGIMSGKLFEQLRSVATKIGLPLYPATIRFSRI